VRLSEDCRYRVAFARGVGVRAQGKSVSARGSPANIPNVVGGGACAKLTFKRKPLITIANAGINDILNPPKEWLTQSSRLQDARAREQIDV
jgi:hypothetical protein